MAADYISWFSKREIRLLSLSLKKKPGGMSTDVASVTFAISSGVILESSSRLISADDNESSESLCKFLDTLKLKSGLLDFDRDSTIITNIYSYIR
jgi:hypothetical protein